MDLLQLYGEVDEILNTLNFDELFQGFYKYRFALYNREEIVLEGKVMPYREESSLLFDVRRISYFVGTIYFLCMEKLGRLVSFEWNSEKTIYEQNSIDSNGCVAEVKNYDFIADNQKKRMQENEAIIQKHMEASEYVDCKGIICGYDPMNMFRLRDMIYCSHFVVLYIDGEMKNINSAVVLRLEEGTNRNIVGYYV